MAKAHQDEQVATPQRPSLDSLLAKTEATLETKTTRQAGDVMNRQLDEVSPKNPDGTTPHFHYYYFDDREISQGRDGGRKAKLVYDLTARGFWPADGSEFVPECPGASIWMTYAANQRRWAKARREELADRLLWLDPIYQAKLAERNMMDRAELLRQRMVG